MNTQVQSRVEYHTEYKYLWGACSQITNTIIFSLAVIISLKITLSIILALTKKKKDKKNKEEDDDEMFPL